MVQIWDNTNSKSTTFEIDNTPPSQPTMIVPHNANTNPFIITGTADKFSIIKLYGNDFLIKQMTIEDNTYSFTVSIHETTSFNVTATDVVGNESVPSQRRTVTFDNTSPVINLTTDKSIVNQGDTITITAVFSEAVNNVTIQINNSDSTSMTSADNLNYTHTYTVTENDNDGTYSIKVSGTDLAGNTTSKSTTFEIDNTPPSQPTMIVPHNANTNPFIITGTADNFSNIKLYGNDSYLDIQPIIHNKYSFTRSITETTRFYVTSTDEVGNVSLPSETVIVTFDNTPPVIDLTTDKSIVKQVIQLRLTLYFLKLLIMLQYK